jgi:hypothetical protein
VCRATVFKLKRSPLERVNGQHAVIDEAPGRKNERKQVFAPAGSLGSGTLGSDTSCTLDRDVQDGQTAGGTVLIAKGETLD